MSDHIDEPEKTILDPDQMEEEEKVLDGRPDVNMTALLTRDVPGG